MKIKLDDKDLAKKMIKPCHFIVEILKFSFKINLESYNISHANSILTFTLIFQNLRFSSDILITS